MSESSSEQQGIPDEALPEDLRPAEDNPLADPDQAVGGDDDGDSPAGDGSA